VTDYFVRDKKTKDNFQALVEIQRSKRLFTIQAALLEYDQLLLHEGMSLGFKDLDAIIHPGMLPGQVCVVIAKTGVGKTAFATQVIHNIAEQEVPCLVFSLEQTRAEIGNRLERIARFKDPKVPRSDLFIRHKKMLINDENRLDPAAVEFLMEEYESLVGTPPKILFIDYLGYWSKGFRGGNSYEKVTAAVMELKAIAKEFRVVVISPHQVSRVGKRGEKLTLDMARDSGAVEETSDFLFSLYAPGQALEAGKPFTDRADVRLDILKSRHGGVGKEARLLWTPYSLALVPRILENVPRVEKEWKMDDRGLPYEEALAVMRGEKFLD
jgi:replicative DNA helicase